MLTIALDSGVGCDSARGATLVEGSGTTRERMLDAGIALWSTEPPAELFAGLSVARIAREAGVTRTTFYAYWSSTEEYLHDLAGHLLRADRGTDPRPAGAGIRALADAGTSFSRGFLASADEFIVAMAADPRLRVQLGLSSKLDDPDIADLLRGLTVGTEAIRSERLQTALPAWGRVARSPLEPHHLHAVATSLAEGLAIRHALDPERFPEQIFGLTMLSLLLVATRRIDDERTLDDVLEVVDDWAARKSELRQTRTSPLDLPLSPADTTRLVHFARRLAASEGWLGVSLNRLAAVTEIPEARVLRTFGSKMGLAMAIFLLNVSERYDDVVPGDDAMADLRTLLDINVDELTRAPAHALAMVALIAGDATFARPSSFEFDPHPRTIDAVARVQAAGDLDPSLDTTRLTTLLLRNVLLDSVPGSTTHDLGVIDIVLRGAATTTGGRAPLA